MTLSLRALAGWRQRWWYRLLANQLRFYGNRGLRCWREPNWWSFFFFLTRKWEIREDVRCGCWLRGASWGHQTNRFRWIFVLVLDKQSIFSSQICFGLFILVWAKLSLWDKLTSFSEKVLPPKWMLFIFAILCDSF